MLATSEGEPPKTLGRPGGFVSLVSLGKGEGGVTCRCRDGCRSG